MKKSISFSIEEDIFQKILMYQANNKLSNRSQALERIVLELDKPIHQEVLQGKQEPNNGLTAEFIEDLIKLVKQAKDSEDTMSMEPKVVKTMEKTSLETTGLKKIESINPIMKLMNQTKNSMK